jgi:very-short-patch-repair endonuclease
MDFLMLLDDHVRIVIEVDGKEHYAEGDKASPRHYAKMVEEDRRLRLQGYELYRFGGAEFPDADLNNGRYTIGLQSKAVVTEFFQCLFNRHKIKP